MSDLTSLLAQALGGGTLTQISRQIGADDNLFDTYPEENPFAGSLGQQYSEASPFGFNGGTWYLRGRFTF